MFHLTKILDLGLVLPIIVQKFCFNLTKILDWTSSLRFNFLNVQELLLIRRVQRNFTNVKKVKCIVKSLSLTKHIIHNQIHISACSFVERKLQLYDTLFNALTVLVSVISIFYDIYMGNFTQIAWLENNVTLC